MHETDTGDEITSARVRTAQIVAVALLNGVLIFAVSRSSWCSKKVKG